MGFLTQHPHNILVHFPIALTWVALVLWLLSFRREEYRYALRVVLVLAGISAVFAYLAGNFQEEAAEERVLESILETHESLGTLTMALLLITALFALLEGWKEWLKWGTSAFFLASVLAVSITGYYGGLVAHPPAAYQQTGEREESIEVLPEDLSPQDTLPDQLHIGGDEEEGEGTSDE